MNMANLSEKTKQAGWLARRAGGVTATECAALLGVTYSFAADKLLSATRAMRLAKAIATNGEKTAKGQPVIRYFGSEAEAAAWGDLLPTRTSAQKAAGWEPSNTIKRERIRDVLPSGGPVDSSRARFVQCSHGVDHRFTVNELPAGYVSKLNPAECREWAKAAA